MPADPRLAEGAVDVVWIDLDRVGDREPELLSEAERARADRFRTESSRRRWAAARGALRAILAHYLDRDPRSLRFATGERGKPLLETGGGPEPLRFNLSHSAGGALCAVSLELEVGVDLEIRSRRVDEAAIAERALGPEAAHRLAALDPPTREREFLRAWVQHEAGLKCRGVGVVAAPREPDPAPPWVIAWELGPRAAAAVACETEPSRLRCWNWLGG